MSRRRRGSILVVSLFLTLILAIVGMAFVTLRGMQYRSAAEAARSSQALAIAEAGLEDALAKLEKDGWFPPPGSAEQVLYAYTEAFAEGSYQVTVDLRWQGSPHQVIVVTSTGILGPAGAPLARRTVSAETRDDGSPRRVVNWRDHGSL